MKYLWLLAVPLAYALGYILSLSPVRCDGGEEMDAMIINVEFERNVKASLEDALQWRQLN